MFDAAGFGSTFLLRGTIVNMTYGTGKNPNIFLFLPTIISPIYYGPPKKWGRGVGVETQLDPNHKHNRKPGPKMDPERERENFGCSALFPFFL